VKNGERIRNRFGDFFYIRSLFLISQLPSNGKAKSISRRIIRLDFIKSLFFEKNKGVDFIPEFPIKQATFPFSSYLKREVCN
jgi:hypothetical protein